MLKVNRLNIFLPTYPQNQVFDSRDIAYHKSNQNKLKSDNFFNIIHNKNLFKIILNWKTACDNNEYEKYPNKTFLLDIKSDKSFFRGILCGVSSNMLDKQIVSPHEKVFEKRVEKLKTYLANVKIQAEPVVFATNFSKEINANIEETVAKKPIKDFTYNNISYSIRELDIKDSINHFNRFYIVDGHHRTSSLKLFSNSSNEEFQLLTFLTDINDIESDKFSWKTTNPSKSLINSINKLSKSFHKPDPQKFWINYKQEYYLIDEFHIGKMTINNFEKWIIQFGDKINRYHFKNNDMPNSPNSVTYNFPTLTFDQIVKTINNNKTFPKKTTYLEPKMLTGLFVSEL
tara:strand:- start:1675 stop:2706 length:1032 start_codon:yes stop_codon:yes gene_type:complete